MLTINLLPPSINAGARRNALIALWVVILLAVVGGLFFYKTTIDAATDKIKADQAAIENDANLAVSLQAQADKINSDSEVVRAKRDFVGQALVHNTRTYQPVVNNIRDYTMRNVLYSSLQPAGQTVQIAAYAPSLSQVGKYIMWMERNPQISNVSIALSGIPGFPVMRGVGGNSGPSVRPPNGTGYDFNVTLTLLKPIAAGPSYGGGGQTASAGGGGFTAPGPGGGGMPGAGMMSGMGAPGPMAAGPAGGGMAPMASGPRPMAAGAAGGGRPVGGGRAGD